MVSLGIDVSKAKLHTCLLREEDGKRKTKVVGDICAAAFFADAPGPGISARRADAQAFPGEHRQNRVAAAPI